MTPKMKSEESLNTKGETSLSPRQCSHEKAQKAHKVLPRAQMKNFAGVMVLLLFGLAGCGQSDDPPIQMREFDLATRVRWVLPPNWTLEEQNQQFIISRKDPVRSHNCIGLDLSWMRNQAALRNFIDEWGSDVNYKIRLRLGPRVDLVQHARLKESNSRIRVTKGSVIPPREFYEEDAMHSYDPGYRQLPDYYDNDASIYVESNLHPWECIYPDEVARECQSVLSGLDLIFSRYPGAEGLRTRSWLGS